METKPKTAFCGLSHLGLVTSICWASFEKVVAIDINEDTIKKLKSNIVPIYEPGLQKLLNKVKKSYYPINDFSVLKSVSLIFFTLDTPLDDSDPKELNFLIHKAIPFLKQGVTLVIISQIPVGYCRTLYKKLVQKRPDLDFSLYHWVNTIVVGNSIERFLSPERIIIGTLNSNQKFNYTLSKVLERFSCRVIKMSFESAEITKMAVNLYLATSITTSNAVSDLCEMVGANINEIIPALQLDKRIGSFAYLRPTLRISGGHLERELYRFYELRKTYAIPETIMDYVIKLNENRFKWLEQKLKKYLLDKVKNPTICLWGLSYKKETTSTQNAASVKVIESLARHVQLTVYDPLAILPKKLKGYRRFEDKYDALKGTNCLIFLTDWDEFLKVDISKMRRLMKNYLIIDCVGILYPIKKNLTDFTYITMGMG